MTPTDLIELAEIKEMINGRRFRPALTKLNALALTYPHDIEIRNLMVLCNEEIANVSKVFAPKSRINLDHSAQEVFIRFRSPGHLAFNLFLIIVSAILFSVLVLYVIVKLSYYLP